MRAIETENAGTSGTRAEEPEQRQDQRGLACAVRAQQAYGLAGTRDAEAAGDPVKDLAPPQPDFQVLEFDDRYGIHSYQCCVAVDCVTVSVRLRFSRSMASSIVPDKRIRLAAWISSGF